MKLTCLDPARAQALAALCETIVPGSSRVGPVVYLDAVLARAPEAVRERARQAVDALAPHAAGGAEALAPHAATPEFQLVRALAIEAFYSDFVAPGSPGPGAYAEIGFEFPLASRIHKDWSYLGVGA
ncbi:MAG: hypothetical protein R2736_08985 [Solirubrobacterales bacterium]